MGKTQKIIKDLLLAFVFISIGFAIGKRFGASSQIPDTAGKPSVVRVYYMHATIRCASCNGIEKMTKNLLETQYAKELAAGKIEFVEENFQKNEKLAKKFDVLASCVVIAKIKNGKIVARQRLDKVWELFRKTPEFNAYLNKAIRKYLHHGDKI